MATQGHASQAAAHALRDALTKARDELLHVDEEFTRRRRRELRAWEDEEPALQVSSLTSSRMSIAVSLVGGV